MTEEQQNDSISRDKPHMSEDKLNYFARIDKAVRSDGVRILEQFLVDELLPYERPEFKRIRPYLTTLYAHDVPIWRVKGLIDGFEDFHEKIRKCIPHKPWGHDARRSEKFEPENARQFSFRCFVISRSIKHIRDRPTIKEYCNDVRVFIDIATFHPHLISECAELIVHKYTHLSIVFRDYGGLFWYWYPSGKFINSTDEEDPATHGLGRPPPGYDWHYFFGQMTRGKPPTSAQAVYFGKSILAEASAFKETKQPYIDSHLLADFLERFWRSEGHDPSEYKRYYANHFDGVRKIVGTRGQSSSSVDKWLHDRAKGIIDNAYTRNEQNFSTERMTTASLPEKYKLQCRTWKRLHFTFVPFSEHDALNIARCQGQIALARLRRRFFSLRRRPRQLVRIKRFLRKFL